jgi:uncharacterized RDD family membrane protein YckC
MATFLDRFLAFLIDSFAIYFISGPIVMIAAVPWYRDLMQTVMTTPTGPPPPGFFADMVHGYWTIVLTYVIAFYALDLINQGLLVGWRGQSIGKLAVRIKVVDENGDPVGWGVGIARGFARFMTGVFLFWLVGWLWMLWDEKSQTLHDKMLRTYVVKLERA